jgi:hypothetical protein
MASVEGGAAGREHLEHLESEMQRVVKRLAEEVQRATGGHVHDHFHAVLALSAAGSFTSQRYEPVRGRPADQSARGHFDHTQPRNTGVRIAQHMKADAAQGRAHLQDQLGRRA